MVMNDTKKMVRLVVYLPPSKAQQLEQIAVILGGQKSIIARKAIEKELARLQQIVDRINE